MHYSQTRGFGRLVIKAIFQVEHKMLESKARVDDLKIVRRKLTSLKAQHMGTFRQNDVYFEVPRGRLKLREVKGNNETELIYYEREDVANPKLDAVCIMKIQEGASLKTLLKRIFQISVTVEKDREIYHYQGMEIRSKYRYVQIHLDKVKDLGFFVEFEMKSSGRTVKKDKQILSFLMNKIGIHSNQLVKWSYADLLKRDKKLEKARVKQT